MSRVFKPGEYVSIDGQPHSKLKVLSYSDVTQKYVLEGNFGTKSTVHRAKVVPYGGTTFEDKSQPNRRNYNEKGIRQRAADGWFRR